MLQSVQHEKDKHRLIRRIGLNSVGSTGVVTPDDPTKSKPTSVQLSRETHKRTQRAPVDPMKKSSTLNAPVNAKMITPDEPTMK